MFKIKFHKSMVTLFVGIMLVLAMACGQKEKVINSYRIDLSENSYLTVETTDSKRTTECFADGEMTQYSVYYLETGEIAHYDFTENSEGGEAKYHIDDFTIAEEEFINSDTTELDANSYILTKETESMRIVELYENDKLIQQTLYYLETGDILCRMWSEGNEGEAIVHYHINDFLVTEEKEEQ